MDSELPPTMMVLWKDHRRHGYKLLGLVLITEIIKITKGQYKLSHGEGHLVLVDVYEGSFW